jgi:hypothetical protein
MTTALKNGSVDATAGGTCTGTITSSRSGPQQLHAAPAQITATSNGSESCELGRGVGNGDLTIDQHQIDFSYTELRAGPALILIARGASAGSALVQANVSLSADPVTIVQDCASGGLSNAPIDVFLATATAISS